MAFIQPFGTLFCPGIMGETDSPLTEMPDDDDEMELPVYDCE